MLEIVWNEDIKRLEIVSTDDVEGENREDLIECLAAEYAVRAEARAEITKALHYIASMYPREEVQ